jgi:fructose-1,6-bisphosphatase/inositol monophosphatase family enzyme
VTIIGWATTTALGDGHHSGGPRIHQPTRFATAWLAAGRLDAYFEVGLKPWDTAAGALLVAEAGGIITRLDGTPYDVRAQDVVAATPAVAPELLEVIRSYGGGAALRAGE